MSKQTKGYIVLGDGRPMEWVVDRHNHGFYFGRFATVFPNWATAKRRIDRDKRENGPSLHQYQIKRVTEGE